MKQQHTHYPLFIKSMASLGMAYALFQTVKHWQDYQALAVLSTALIHVPMAAFSTRLAFLTVRTNPLFSFLAAAFVCLNAALV